MGPHRIGGQGDAPGLSNGGAGPQTALIRRIQDKTRRGYRPQGGIGKSRLVQRFREEIAATPYTWLECATAPFFQNTPFYAVADMLQQSFNWEASHTVEERLAALEASLGLAGLDPDETAPLIAPLLELPVGTRYPPLSMAPDQQRKRLLATVVAWTLGAAKAQPLVIATEDLH
jgi:predicted ATPase